MCLSMSVHMNMYVYIDVHVFVMCLNVTLTHRTHRYMDSPYHNSRHAADVTQGMYYLIAFGGNARSNDFT